MTDFVIAVKSTIDKVGKDLSTSLGIPDFVDLDDTVNVADVLSGTKSAVVWRFMNLDEDPIDPLYALSFMIGIKTTSDVSNYSMLNFISTVKSNFSVSGKLKIRDWSGTVVPDMTTDMGYMFFTDSGVDSQVLDRESGVRMLTVEARAARRI